MEKIKLNLNKKIIYKLLKKISYLIPFVTVCSLGCNRTCAAECPFGLFSDPYPGQCSRFTDINGDNNCDLSESGQINTTDSEVLNNSNLDNNINNTDISHVNNTDYFVIPISLIILTIYIISYVLIKKNIITPKKQKKLWSIFLLMTTLGSGLTGIILIISINFAIYLYNNIILFYHVEISIIMVLITLIHIHIHRKPIMKIFKLK